MLSENRVPKQFKAGFFGPTWRECGVGKKQQGCPALLRTALSLTCRESKNTGCIHSNELNPKSKYKCIFNHPVSVSLLPSVVMNTKDFSKMPGKLDVVNKCRSRKVLYKGSKKSEERYPILKYWQQF